MEKFAKAYQVLGLQPNADLKEVKKTYRRLALKYHPDINDSPEAHQQFILIKKAYEVITTADQTFVQKVPYQDADHSGNRNEQGKNPSSKDPRKQNLSREERIRRAREAQRLYEERQIKKEARQYKAFRQSFLYPWTMVMTYTSLVFFILILLDAFVLKKPFEGVVMEKTPIEVSVITGHFTPTYLCKLSNGLEVEIPSYAAKSIALGSYIRLKESMVFGDIPEISVLKPDFTSITVEAFNKPPYLFFLMFLGVPLLYFFVDKPSAVFYSAGAYSRYIIIIVIAVFLIF